MPVNRSHLFPSDTHFQRKQEGNETQEPRRRKLYLQDKYQTVRSSIFLHQMIFHSRGMFYPAYRAFHITRELGSSKFNQ